MASILFSFKACLAVAPGIVASEDFEDRLGLTCRDLAVFGDHALFDLLVGLREERFRAEVHEVRFYIADDAIVKVIHEIKDLRLLGEFDSDSLTSLNLVIQRLKSPDTFSCSCFS